MLKSVFILSFSLSISFFSVVAKAQTNGFAALKACSDQVFKATEIKSIAHRIVPLIEGDEVFVDHHPNQDFTSMDFSLVRKNGEAYTVHFNFYDLESYYRSVANPDEAKVEFYVTIGGSLYTLFPVFSSDDVKTRIKYYIFAKRTPLLEKARTDFNLLKGKHVYGVTDTFNRDVLDPILSAERGGFARFLDAFYLDYYLKTPEQAGLNYAMIENFQSIFDYIHRESYQAASEVKEARLHLELISAMIKGGQPFPEEGSIGATGEAEEVYLENKEFEEVESRNSLMKKMVVISSGDAEHFLASQGYALVDQNIRRLLEQINEEVTKKKSLSYENHLIALSLEEKLSDTVKACSSLSAASPLIIEALAAVAQTRNENARMIIPDSN